MSVRHDGKSPSKLWYMWQTTKGLLLTPFDFTTRKDAGQLGKSVGLTVGIGVGADLLLGTAIVAATPILPWVIGGTAFYFMWKYGSESFTRFQGLKSTSVVYNYVHAQEDKWLKKKTQAPLLTRIKNSIHAKLDKIPATAMKVAKWLGVAGAVTAAAAATSGALSYLGVPAFSTGATATAVLGGIAKAGAVIGLTAAASTGVALAVAVLAIPAALGVTLAASHSVARRDAGRPTFGSKPPQPGAKPLDKGVVFSAEKGSSFDFNDNAPAKKSESDALREKAAQARKANRDRRDNSNRF